MSQSCAMGASLRSRRVGARFGHSRPACGPKKGRAASGGELNGLVPLFVVRDLNGSLQKLVVRVFGWMLFFTVGVGTAWANAPEPQRPTPQRPASSSKPATSAQPAAPAKAAATAPAEPSKTVDPTASPPGATGERAKTTDPVDGASGARASEIHGDRLDGLQVEVDDLKDKIFRSKARLQLLKETVLRGVLAGSRLVLAHRNVMGSSFRLVRITFILDGAQIYARTDETGNLDQEDELVVYDGNIPPGPHNITIELTYKGHGYGVFSYLSGYTFESRSSHSFTAPENGALKLNAVGFERGNLTTEMRDRPSVDWQEIPLDATGRPLPNSARNARRRGAQ
jgi:hypothetical protein